MKHLKFLSIIAAFLPMSVVAMCFSSCMQQNQSVDDSYIDALKTYMNKSEGFELVLSLTELSLKQYLDEISADVIADKVLAEQMSRKYTSEKLGNDIIELFFAPSFSKYVSESDLREMAKIYENPKYKTFFEREKEYNIGMVADLLPPVFDMSQSLNKTGEMTFEPVKPSSECTDEYIKLFDSYFGMSQEEMAELLENNLAPDIEEKRKDSKLGPVIDASLKYLKENMKTIMLNSCIKYMTIDDLKVGIELRKNSVYQKFQKMDAEERLNKKTDADEEKRFEEIKQELRDRYTAWLKTNNVQMK